MKTFNPCAFIAYKGREPYGFIEFLPYSIAKGIGFESKSASEDKAVITYLLVRQKAWGGGIASKLVQVCTNNLKSRGFKKLEVKAHTSGRWHPIAFYEKCGFKLAKKLDEKS
ncbi:MAG: Acetyltransferase (GNAT) family protein [Candidatus Bathyarchaeota archaeon BA1]|nr:MAG: Acetyltransferase (GNAT) family protein [Candidatus Bathyarchaeota archaeon BA1]